MKSIILDEFVNVKAGEPYRLFPFGKIVKNGKMREITPEFAATIKLPHFKPAIKLGSHNDETPAGGHIVGLEVRADGLYAIPEFNDNGIKAIHDGAYRYHSPEIIWEGGLETPAGGAINAPLIVGDALLHTPHLGESTAMYSIEEITQEKIMNENMNIPVSFWDKFVTPLLNKPAEVKEVVKEVAPEDYEATKTELAQYKAEADKLKAETERKSRVDKFEAEIKDTKADPALASLLADVPQETADAIMKQFKALSAQIDETSLKKEQGTPENGNTDDPKAAFNAAVLAVSKEKKINYNAAFEEVKVSQPDLFKAAFAKR